MAAFAERECLSIFCRRPAADMAFFPTEVEASDIGSGAVRPRTVVIPGIVQRQ